MESQFKELHTLLIERIYHEDQLLSQRTYNFLTINVFLATAFALSFTANINRPFGYIIMLFALILAIFQVFLGQRTARAILFWREYTKLVEEENGIEFDQLLFQYYKTARVNTRAGIIDRTKVTQPPMNSIFPWNLCLPFTNHHIVPSTNTLVGIVIPWMVSIFWFWILLEFLYNDHLIWVIPIVVIPFLFIVIISIIKIPAIPEGISKKQSDDIDI